MTRNRWIALGIVALAAAFLIGLLPSWSRARMLERQLAETRHELQLSRMQTRLGAALAEAQRSNYERARQLMAGFFSELQSRAMIETDPARRDTFLQILQQRDELITLLSRAEPESVQRLNLFYTRFFAATDPAGAQAPPEPAAVTPPPPES